MEGWTFCHKTWKCEFLLWRACQSLMAEQEIILKKCFVDVFSDVKSFLWKYCFTSYWSFLLSYLLSWFIFQFSEQHCIFNRINPLMIHLQLSCRSQCDAVFSLHTVAKKQWDFDGAAFTSSRRWTEEETLRCCWCWWRVAGEMDSDQHKAVNVLTLPHIHWAVRGSSTSLHCLSILSLLLHLSHTRCCLLSIDQISHQAGSPWWCVWYAATLWEIEANKHRHESVRMSLSL